MSSDLELIEAELVSVGGRLQWATDFGLGISFAPEATDEAVESVRESVLKAAWIDFCGTRITDRTLALLEHSRLLESLRLKETKITISGLRRLLEAVPTLQQLELSFSAFGSDEINTLCKTFLRLVILCS